MFSDIKKSFEELAAAHFLIRVPSVESEIHGCPQFVTNFDPFAISTNIMEKKEGNENKIV